MMNSAGLVHKKHPVTFLYDYCRHKLRARPVCKYSEILQLSGIEYTCQFFVKYWVGTGRSFNKKQAKVKAAQDLIRILFNPNRISRAPLRRLVSEKGAIKICGYEQLDGNYFDVPFLVKNDNTRPSSPGVSECISSSEEEANNSNGQHTSPLLREGNFEVTKEEESENDSTAGEIQEFLKKASISDRPRVIFDKRKIPQRLPSIKEEEPFDSCPSSYDPIGYLQYESEKDNVEICYEIEKNEKLIDATCFYGNLSTIGSAYNLSAAKTLAAHNMIKLLKCQRK